MPEFFRFTLTATRDHILFKQVNLTRGFIITFNKGYVDYSQYKRLLLAGITYVTKLRKNTKYYGIGGINIPDDADYGIIKDEVIVLIKWDLEHKCRWIAYWEDLKEKLIVFLTNNLEFLFE